MSKIRVLQVVGALLLTCSVTLSAADNRELGNWRLSSERVVEGSSTTPHLAANTIMIVRQGAIGNFVVQVEPKQPWVTDRTVMMHADFSPDGKSKTETIISGKPEYRLIRVWDKQ